MFTVDDPPYEQYVVGLFADLTALGDDIVSGGVHYYLTGDESLVSASRRTTVISLLLPKKGNGDSISPVHDVVDRANQGDSFQVFTTGDATLEADFTGLAERDLLTGETIGIPVALVVLALVFGTIVAALVPLVLALVGIVVALGATALVGLAFDLSFFVTNMITMMGLAVGIDYSLFIVSRFREERARGRDKMGAIAITGATASRAMLFSGVTVVLALCGLLIFPMSVFRSIGIGAILVVVMVILASLILLPAMLSLLGDRVNALRIPLPSGAARSAMPMMPPVGSGTVLPTW